MIAGRIPQANFPRAPAVPQFRADVEWSLFTESSSNRWVAKDPISLEYFYFSHVEKRLTEMLDGRTTPGEILRKLQFQFPAAGVSDGWLRRMLDRLNHACLLVTESDAEHWLERKRRLEHNHFFSRLLSPLAIRIPLCDPTLILNFFDGFARWLFSRTVVITSLVVLLLVAWLVLLRVVGTISLTQSLVQLAQGDRLLWLIFSYIIVKSLHELGHALACRRVGAECHDIGILLLCFAPCLYCDVSDTWKIPSRFKRAAVSAAGIYIEMNLAAIAGLIWLTSQPGVVNTLAANIMIVCSLGTILVNANPLLRYDGYYVLSDLWGVPNAMQQGQEALREWVMAGLSATKMPRNRWDASPLWLVLFGLSAFVYRAVLLGIIASIFYWMAAQYGLHWLGQVIIWACVLGWAIPLAKSAWGIAHELLHTGKLSLGRSIIWVLVAGMVGGFICLTPLPTYVRARGVCRYTQCEPIFAHNSAVIQKAERVETNVDVGEPVVELVNFEDQVKLLEMQADIAQLAERVEDLKTRSVDDELAPELLPTASQSLTELRGQATAFAADLEKLKVHAPYAGFVLAGNWRQPKALAGKSHEVEVRGPVLQESIGCAVERGELLAWIANPDMGFQIEALISEQDTDLVQVGARVRCRWDCAPSQLIFGSVQSISTEPVTVTPMELVGDHEFMSNVNRKHVATPENPSYLVVVNLDEIPDSAAHGSLVTAKIQVDSRTLWQSFVRTFRQTFLKSSLHSARSTSPAQP